MRTTEKQFDTSVYVAAHGKAPRGYGMWHFQRTVQSVDGTTVMLQTASARGTFTEARLTVGHYAAPAGFRPIGTGWTVCS
jgi:hypothetical protein